MVEHDTLFMVYRHPSTACIFALGENKDTFVQVDKTDEGVSVKDVAFGTGVREMAKRLKLGYLLAPNKMYFNQRSGEFKLVHPDLDWKGLVWVLAAMPKNIEQACEKVAQVVKTVPASIILGEEIDAWMSQQSHNVAHVVAFGDLPVWTLALAQVALDNGWPLRAMSTQSGVPDAPPAIVPQQWMTWLSKVFPEKTIAHTQVALGWTVEKIIISDTALPVEGDVSAFL